MITLQLTADEAEIVRDALETDLEGYEDCVRDARANSAKAEVEAFEEAANRIRLVIEKVTAALSG